MKPCIICYAFLCLTHHCLAQYTYFNQGYPPPEPQLGGGQCLSLILKQDTLCTIATVPIENSEIARSMHVLDPTGELIAHNVFPLGDEIHFTTTGDAYISREQGYVWSGKIHGYPHILYFDHSFNEVNRIAYEQFLTDTTFGGFNSTFVCMDETILSAGYHTFDNDTMAAGMGWGHLLLCRHSDAGDSLWFREYTAEDLGVIQEYGGPFIYAHGGTFELDTGEIIVFGQVGNPTDCYVFKFDHEGNFITSTKWGQMNYNEGRAWPVQTGPSSFTYAFGTFYDQVGQYYWSRPRIGTVDVSTMQAVPGNFFDHEYLYGTVTDLERSPDGGFLMLGFGTFSIDENAQRKAFVIKTNEEGDEEWFKEYSPSEEFASVEAWDLDVTEDGGFAFVGNFLAFDIYTYKSWVVKADACGELVYNGCPTVVGVAENDATNPFELFPNPASDILTIRSDYRQGTLIRVHDLTGRSVVCTTTSADLSSTLDISALPSGVYEVVVGEGHDRTVRRFVKQ